MKHAYVFNRVCNIGNFFSYTSTCLYGEIWICSVSPVKQKGWLHRLDSSSGKWVWISLAIYDIIKPDNEIHKKTGLWPGSVEFKGWKEEGWRWRWCRIKEKTPSSISVLNINISQPPHCDVGSVIYWGLCCCLHKLVEWTGRNTYLSLLHFIPAEQSGSFDWTELDIWRVMFGQQARLLWLKARTRLTDGLLFTLELRHTGHTFHFHFLYSGAQYLCTFSFSHKVNTFA